MLNRAEILRSAWAAYRLARPAVFAAGDEAGKRVFIRDLFAKMLRRAWDEAKKAVRVFVDTARDFLASQHKARVALAASYTPQVRSARIAGVRDELSLLDYAPWSVRVAPRRSALNEELAALEAACV